jgi:hypothetical protein
MKSLRQFLKTGATPAKLPPALSTNSVDNSVYGEVGLGTGMLENSENAALVKL